VFSGKENGPVTISSLPILISSNLPVKLVIALLIDVIGGYKLYFLPKIQQIAVRNDARRLHYGTALLDVCRQFCEKFHRTGFTLRCRIDLESNNFWQALGFEKYGVWEKGKIKSTTGFKASNDINLWKIELNSKMITLFDETHKKITL